ncbi:MAG: hypothetical protein GY856_42115 [bacterium]|nr:hypothetical protein [bacterium]
MGEVYRAWDEDLHRQVAIKLIRAAVPESATSEERSAAVKLGPGALRLHTRRPYLAHGAFPPHAQELQADVPVAVVWLDPNAVRRDPGVESLGRVLGEVGGGQVVQGRRLGPSDGVVVGRVGRNRGFQAEREHGHG